MLPRCKEYDLLLYEDFRNVEPGDGNKRCNYKYTRQISELHKGLERLLGVV